MEGRVLCWEGVLWGVLFPFYAILCFVQLQGKLCVLLLVLCMERVLSCIMTRKWKTTCSPGYQSIHFILYILKNLILFIICINCLLLNIECAWLHFFRIIQFLFSELGLHHTFGHLFANGLTWLYVINTL